MIALLLRLRLKATMMKEKLEDALFTLAGVALVIGVRYAAVYFAVAIINWIWGA